MSLTLRLDAMTSLLTAATCTSVPGIKIGNHVYDPTTGIVNYTCNVGYYMPTHKVTQVILTCDCNDTMDPTSVENCRGITLKIFCNRKTDITQDKVISYTFNYILQNYF